MKRAIIRETDIREMAREIVLEQMINEAPDLNSKIVALILSMKDLLRKKNFVCSVNYTKPEPEKRHRNYGYCNIKVDTTQGRGSSMSNKSISNLIKRSCDKLGLSKYFDFHTSGNDGRFCDCGLSLKSKYVQKCMEVI